jgi:hypothetical protein
MTLEGHAQRLAQQAGVPVDAATKALRVIARLRPLTSGLVDDLIELQLLADSVIREVSSGRKVWVWADMLES